MRFPDQWLAACALLASAALAWTAHAEPCGTAANQGDGWTVAPPHERGLDAAKICAIGPRLAGLAGANAHGVVVARNGAIVYEAYFRGDDRRWPQKHWQQPLIPTDHDWRTRHDVQSISKSVTALLVGAALDRSHLKSVDETALSLLTDYADLRTVEKDRIRVRDFLTMTSGLDWPQRPYLSMSRRMEASADPARFVLEQKMMAAPGVAYRYNNGSVEVVGAILKKVTGKPVDQYAKEVLFDPLGIDDWEWGTMANGDPGASWGLRLRLRDLAKLGQVVLERGTWRGQRLLPATWIDIMTAPQIVQRKTTYGFLWWLDHERVGQTEVKIVSGYGWGGQLVCVVPSLGLVVAVNAGVYNFEGGGQQNLAADAVLESVLAAVANR